MPERQRPRTKNGRRLSRWLEDNEVHVTDFALRIGVSQVHLYAILRGSNRPSVELAKLINKKTRDAVPALDWF